MSVMKSRWIPSFMTKTWWIFGYSKPHPNLHRLVSTIKSDQGTGWVRLGNTNFWMFRKMDDYK